MPREPKGKGVEGPGEGLPSTAEGLLSAATENPEATAGLLSAASAVREMNSDDLRHQLDSVRSPEDAIEVAGNVANKLANTTAGQQVLEQAARAKALYDEQTTNRITKVADDAMRKAQGKLVERAQGPGGGLLLGLAGTIGGIADQAAGPSAAVVHANEVPGTRPEATRNPPSMPTKLQLATMLANEEETERKATAAFRAGDKDGKGGLSKLEAQATIQQHFKQHGNTKDSPTMEFIGNLFGAQPLILCFS
jgi:hypothetical protein